MLNVEPIKWGRLFRLGVRTISAADGGAVQPSGRGTHADGALSEIDFKDEEASKQASKQATLEVLAAFS